MKKKVAELRDYLLRQLTR